MCPFLTGKASMHVNTSVLCAPDLTDIAQEQQKIIRVVERTILEGTKLFILDFQLQETKKTNEQADMQQCVRVQTSKIRIKKRHKQTTVLLLIQQVDAKHT
jgi:hypothetical protein